MTGQLEKLHRTLKASLSANEGCGRVQRSLNRSSFDMSWGKCITSCFGADPYLENKKFAEAEVLLALGSCQDVSRKTN